MENKLLSIFDDGLNFEDSDRIVINRGCLKFGKYVYQFSNVTGFSVGEYEKQKFPKKEIFFLVFFGILLLTIFVGVIFLIIAYMVYRKHKNIKQVHYLCVLLNSGGRHYFRSTDKDGLLNIINSMYKIMTSSSNREFVIDMSTNVVDMSDRKIEINGDVSGNLISGDSNNIY
ncbi:hypothetical protein [Sessilibacter sp. MAH2]